MKEITHKRLLCTTVLTLLITLVITTGTAFAGSTSDAEGNTLTITGTVAAGQPLHVDAIGVNQDLYTEDPAQIDPALPDGQILYLPNQIRWTGAYNTSGVIDLAPGTTAANITIPYVGAARIAVIFQKYTLQTLPQDQAITSSMDLQNSVSATAVENDPSGESGQAVQGSTPEEPAQNDQETQDSSMDQPDQPKQPSPNRVWTASETFPLMQSVNVLGTVCFDSGVGHFKNGDPIRIRYYKNGTTMTKRPLPTAKKRFFMGWYTKKSGGKLVNKKTKVHFGKKQKVTYYARWGKKGTKSPVISYKGKNAKRIPVLCYHRLCSPAEKNKHRGSFSSLFMSETKFRQEMKWLHDHHYTTLSMKEFYLWHQGKIKVPRKSVVITFDDGMYSIIKYGLPILEKYDMKATMFMIGKAVPNKTNKRPTRYGTYHTTGRDVIDYVSKKYPDFEFQSHTWGLHVRTGSGAGYAKTKSYNYQKKDFEKMYKKFGYEYLAYPFGHYTSRTIRAAKKGHIKMAFTYGSNTWATRSQGRYTIRRIKADGDESLSRFTRWFYK